MHLETIQHLRSLASQHDDLVPIAKPLLLDLLDSYERHAGKEQRLLTGLVESERELAQIREAGTPACPINASMTHHAALHGLPHWQCVSHKSNAWWRRVDGYEETYFDATTSYPDVLRRIDELVPMADPDTLPDPQDLQRLRYQPHWSGREMDAIDELSRLKDLEPVAIVRQALRHYQLAHAELNNPALEPADVLTGNEELIAQLTASLATIAGAAHMIIEAYDPRFFRAGAWAKAALQACQEQFPTPETSVSPKYLIISDERRTHGMVWFYAPDSKGYTVCTARAGRFTEAEAAAILAGTSGELSALRESDLPKLQILHHIDRGYGDNGAILKNLITHVLPTTESPPVNTVNSVNPVTAPETFEAHGHTWTRHTPGDPCPVPWNTLVSVLLAWELKADELPSKDFVSARSLTWSRTGHAGIIGWRYAEPQPSTSDK